MARRPFKMPDCKPFIQVEREVPLGGWTVASYMAYEFKRFWRDESGIGPLALFVVSFALQVVGYLLAPQPRQPDPPNAEDIRVPTSEAGRPIPILFGMSWLMGPNVAHFTDKETRRRLVKA